MKLTSRAGAVVDLFKQTATEWIADDVPQLGRALAYYRVFSLARLVLVSLAVIGFVFHQNPAGAWNLLWVYYSSQILLFGAEVTQVYAKRRDARIEPDEYTVRIERKEIEKPSR